MGKNRLALTCSSPPIAEVVAVLDLDLLRSIGTQLMSGDRVEVKGRTMRMWLTQQKRPNTVSFTINGRKYQAIEQNPEKLSTWGQLARTGHQVVQFKDVERSKFVAVAVDGEVEEYGRIGRR